jgi:hypothetical protein
MWLVMLCLGHCDHSIIIFDRSAVVVFHQNEYPCIANIEQRHIDIEQM